MRIGIYPIMAEAQNAILPVCVPMIAIGEENVEKTLLKVCQNIIKDHPELQISMQEPEIGENFPWYALSTDGNVDGASVIVSVAPKSFNGGYITLEGIQ